MYSFFSSNVARHGSALRGRRGFGPRRVLIFSSAWRNTRVSDRWNAPDDQMWGPVSAHDRMYSLFDYAMRPRAVWSTCLAALAARWKGVSANSNQQITYEWVRASVPLRMSSPALISQLRWLTWCRAPRELIGAHFGTGYGRLFADWLTQIIRSTYAYIISSQRI